MPVYNGAKFLAQAIDSILTQTYRHFEFIIVDDGSKDQTSQILSSIADPRIRVITHSGNQGIVSALNDGINSSHGKYLARMDADDLSDPRRFALQVAYLETHRSCAAVGTFIKLTTPSGKLLYTIEPPTRNLAIKNFLLKNSCLAHGSVMMKRDAVIAVGMYSHDKKVKHAEDYDLFVRLTQNFELGNLPEYLYTRKEHPGSVSHQNFAIQQRSASYISKQAKKLIKLPPKPKFSVLMPNYNKAKYIGEAIESVLAQTFTDWELIIADDHSTDHSEKIIQKYLTDKRIIYLKNPVNLGIAKTKNILAGESIADIFGELDSDDVLEPTALAEMHRAHTKHPSVGFIYSQFVYCDQKLNPINLGFCRASEPGETYLHSNFASAFRTYKRKYFDQTSSFDVNLPGAEDRDVIYKMEEVTPIFFIDQVLYRYRLDSSKKRQDIMIGLYSHAKAKYFAYIRRRTYHLPNITFFELARQILNLAYSAITI